MKAVWSMPLLFVLIFAGRCGSLTADEARDEGIRQVRQAETDFAATMAGRDLARFASFIAEEAVFIGQRGTFRGKASVIQAWKGYFDGAAAPFSWEPRVVEVLDSGKLAFTSGPVRDPQGRETATFNSVWRREADGSWKVVFDRGCPGCNCSGSD